MKTHNAFFSSETISAIRKNLETNKAAAKMAAEFINSTSYWMNLTYDALQGLIFTPELKRSWFVRSDGNCPSCKESVPMYNWKYDPIKMPWKMQCPHCNELFPKNDFHAYYTSGLDKNGDFRHTLANRNLLVNPDGSSFGVDDGNGWYDSNRKRYMFIGAYLSHSHWTKLIIEGLTNLSFSYVLTGNIEYAKRAGIILNSITRHFPDYDFYTQGIMYEQEFKSKGYVNYWVNSNREIRFLALSYDQIFDALKDNSDFISIIGKSFIQFCTDVEERIFFDAFNNMEKIHTNPPETPITVSIIKTVLNYPEKEIAEAIDEIIFESTRVDGLSGEKGLAGYAAITPRSLADMLCFFTNIDSDIIDKSLKKHPVLYNTYRFHLDTWYDTSYYPGIGDNSVFSIPMKQYTGLFSIHAPVSSIYHRSREWFALKLSRFFGDPDFAKSIYLSNNNDIKGCFSEDYYVQNPENYEQEVLDIIEIYGEELNQSSINYNKWRISLLHTGISDNKTLYAMPYDTGANHCHHDALSLHIFSKGINITPDFGYPPVNYGGWKTKEAYWYRHPAAHNQVVIDGKWHTNIPPDGDGMFYRFPKYGKNIMFASGSFVKASYNDSREYADIARYERLIAVIDISDTDCYSVDISRTEGGKSHSRFLRSSYSTITTSGLNLIQGESYFPNETIMRNFKSDQSPSIPWSVDFKLYSDGIYNPLKKDIHLKYTGLSKNAKINTCESWVDITRMSQTSDIRTGNQVVWIPTIFETKDGPRTQFTGIHEVYENNSKISSITRVKCDKNDFDEAIKIIHSDGTCDYILSNDHENNTSIHIQNYDISSDALLAVIRFKGAKLIKASVCSGTYIDIKSVHYTADTKHSNVEFL